MNARRFGELVAVALVAACVVMLGGIGLFALSRFAGVPVSIELAFAAMLVLTFQLFATAVVTTILVESRARMRALRAMAINEAVAQREARERRRGRPKNRRS